MSNLVDRALAGVPAHAGKLLVIFCLCLVALNFGRLDEWGEEGFRHYLSEAIMQTTLFDFAWVLLILSYFIHLDAKKHSIRWMWILPTFPFMPTIGLLAYFLVRERSIHASKIRERAP